ncbi:hypothetical protein ACH4PU_32770 [Streptomyces sp. NPDC021100]|uniref:hypothetical protein n=1 Tax=Streptomyces sp. NPDC021100 TaxID=3365114 RepID=UPI0037AE32A4
MKPETGEPECDLAAAARQVQGLLGMAERLMNGTFSQEFGLDREGQAQMVEALYIRVGGLAAGIVRARSGETA